MTVEIMIEDTRWDEAALTALAQRACAATLGHLSLDPEVFEISLMACDDARIGALNAQFRGKATPTNVLSWPTWDLSPDTPGDRPEAPEPGTPDDPEALGDIALAYDTCRREAEEQGKSFEAHVTHLVVHSVLHLLGYDHVDPADADRMERTEVEILAQLGISDPYDGGGAMDPVIADVT